MARGDLKADRYFYDQVFAMLKDLAFANERALGGRRNVDDFLDAYDASRGRDSEDRGFRLADSVLNEIDRRGWDERNKKDVSDVVYDAFKRLVERISRDMGSRRRDDRRDDRRDRGYSSFGSPRSIDDRRYDRRDERPVDSLIDDAPTSSRDDVPEIRAERKEERREERREEREVPTDTQNPARYHSPITQLTDEMIQSVQKGTFELTRNDVEELEEGGFVADKHYVRLTYGPVVCVSNYRVRLVDPVSSVFEAVKKYAEAAPIGMLQTYWSVKIDYRRYCHLNISVEDYLSLKEEVTSKMRDGEYFFAVFFDILSHRTQFVYREVSKYLKEEFLRMFKLNVRSTSALNLYLKFSQIEDIETILSPDFKVSIAEDPLWYPTIIRLIEEVLKHLFSIDVLNSKTAIEGMSWEHYFRYDKIVADKSVLEKPVSRFQLPSLTLEEQQNYLDAVNKKMIFWTQSESLLYTDILSHATMRRIGDDPITDHERYPDLHVVTSLLVGYADLNKSSMKHVAVYGALYKELPDVYLRRFDIVHPMSTSAHPTSYLIKSPCNVVGFM